MTTFFYDRNNELVEANLSDINAAKFNASRTIGTITKTARCTRCGGSGIYSTFHGVCFRCGGCGVDPHTKIVTKIYTEKALNTLRKTRETRRINAVKKENQRVEAINRKKMETIETNGMAPAIEWISSSIIKKGIESTSFENFLSDLYVKLNSEGVLSEKQIEVIKNAYNNHVSLEEKKAVDAKNASPCPEGRVDITGEVITTKWKSSYYGDTLKMLVRSTDGYKVWGSVPTSLASVKKGETIKFTATLEKSKDDETFGFFKRPAKASIVTI